MALTKDDWKAVVTATAAHSASMIVMGAIYGRDDSLVAGFKALKKPWWALDDFRGYHAGVFLLAPTLGCATALLYKYGDINNTETKAAIGGYAVTNIIGYLGMGQFYRTRCLKTMFLTDLAMLATASATTYAFHKVNEQAGWFMIPFTLWIAHGTALAYSLWSMNPDAEFKRAGQNLPGVEKKSL